MWWKDGKLAWGNQHCGIGLWTAVCKKSYSTFLVFFSFNYFWVFCLKKHRSKKNIALRKLLKLFSYLAFKILWSFYKTLLTQIFVSLTNNIYKTIFIKLTDVMMDGQRIQ